MGTQHNVKSRTIRKEMRDAGFTHVRTSATHEIWETPDGEERFAVSIGGRTEADPKAVRKIRKRIERFEAANDPPLREVKFVCADCAEDHLDDLCTHEQPTVTEDVMGKQEKLAMVPNDVQGVIAAGRRVNRSQSWVHAKIKSGALKGYTIVNDQGKEIIGVSMGALTELSDNSQRRAPRAKQAKKPKAADALPKAKPVETTATRTEDRLRAALTDVALLMGELGYESLTVTDDGKVNVTRRVVETFEL
jgi:predicted RNA binding protein YcfA (HicA-like mRNA interferase family)